MDLKKLGVKELASLQADIQSELLRKKQENRREVINQVKNLLAENGMTLDDLPKRSGASNGARATVQPKYRNPKDPQQTWSGRGRKPLWVVAYLAKNKNLDGVKI